MTIVAADVQSKLVSLDDLYALLKITEPLTIEPISGEQKIKFSLAPDWALSLDSVHGNSPVEVFMSVNGEERQMTKDAAIQSAANFGLTSTYIKHVPAHYIEQLLNYHYSKGMGDREFNVLSVKGNVAAFTRPTIYPFSNISLLEQVVESICAFYSIDADAIQADYKFQNTLHQTDIRLVVPEVQRHIKNGGMADVATLGATDLWSAGIHLSNSLVGKTQTGVDAYLFRWACTNGATVSYDTIGTWSRKSNSEAKDQNLNKDGDVYDWARLSVDAILGGLETRFDEVQALTALKTAGNTSDIFREIFSEYDVPKTQQADIANALLENDTLSMYTIMNAITSSANAFGLDPARADKLMRIGGQIPTHTFDTLKAKVWREGNQAEKKAINPYEPTVID